MEERACREKGVWEKFIFLRNECEMTWMIICDSGKGVTYDPCHFCFSEFHCGKNYLRKICLDTWVRKFFGKWKCFLTWEK